MKSQISSSVPLISCLCVTENRSAFMSWLLWNFDRQTWAHKELVIIDSSVNPFASDREDVRVIPCRPGTGVAIKRNLAMKHAAGEYLSWFDDDDWQHPMKLEFTVGALKQGAPFVGCSKSWFLDLISNKCTSFNSTGSRILFNSACFQTVVARRIEFPKYLKKASDTHWMNHLKRNTGTAGKIIDQPLFFWLSHQTNLCNPSKRRRFEHSIETLKSQIGEYHWGDTEQALSALKQRLAEDVNIPSNGGLSTPKKHIHHDSHQPSLVKKEDSNCAPVSVAAIVKATVLDTEYLGVMVPHMLTQAHYPFSERVIVVDPRAEFEGKYRNRQASTRTELDKAIAGLIERGQIDRVLEVPYDSTTIEQINKRYFNRVDVPTHATSGGPIYPTLWAMEQVNSDFLLQLDADMFFYSDGDSWVARALSCMQRDPRMWLAMTHPSPPVGPPGKSLSGANLRRARWDATLGVWKFRTASTRFFLTDRRKLRKKLPKLGIGQNCRPLEQCISSALSANNAYRGDIGNGRTWHLHAHSHASPFPEWAPKIIEKIEQGVYPAFQSGKYDMCLDKPQDHAHWKSILFPSRQPTTQRICKQSSPKTKSKKNDLKLKNALEYAPIQVIIPVRNREGSRIKATLDSLTWQSLPPTRTILVSHGSDTSYNTDLEALCQHYQISFANIGKPSDPWCKPMALNYGIKNTPEDVPYIMTLDADMILAPNFFEAVNRHLIQVAAPGAMVLCRSCDLPQTAKLPIDPADLQHHFSRLRNIGRMRGQQGCGGIQAAPRSFYFAVQGYDEGFTWWGEEDQDMVARAKAYGMEIHWIDNETSMLHQWHPHATRPAEPNQRQKMQSALKRNRELRLSRANLLVRNESNWNTNLST